MNRSFLLSAVLIAASPSLGRAGEGQPVEIPDSGGWHVHWPVGFSKESEASQELDFTRDEGNWETHLSVATETEAGPDCGFEQAKGAVEKGKRWGLPTCEQSLAGGGKAYRIQSEESVYLQLTLQVGPLPGAGRGEAPPADFHQKAEKAYRQMRSTLAPKGVTAKPDDSSGSEPKPEPKTQAPTDAKPAPKADSSPPSKSDDNLQLDKNGEPKLLPLP